MPRLRARSIDHLDRDHRWYARLLADHCGELAPAAHELATLKLAQRSTGNPVPDEREVWAAAYEIAFHLRPPWLEPIPSREALAADCRALGLEVI